MVDRAPFISQLPRPYIRLSRISAVKGSVSQPSTGTVSEWPSNARPPCPSPLRPTRLTFSTPLSSWYVMRSTSKPSRSSCFLEVVGHGGVAVGADRIKRDQFLRVTWTGSNIVGACFQKSGRMPIAVKWMPEVGLEPTRPCGQGILSPSRLPIPPLRHNQDSPPEACSLGGLSVNIKRGRRDSNPQLLP